MPPRVTHAFEAPGQLRETDFITVDQAAVAPAVAFTVVSSTPVSLARLAGPAFETAEFDVTVINPTTIASFTAMQIPVTVTRPGPAAVVTAQNTGQSARDLAQTVTNWITPTVTRPGSAYVTPAQDTGQSSRDLAQTVTTWVYPRVQYPGRAFTTNADDPAGQSARDLAQQFVSLGRPSVRGNQYATVFVDTGVAAPPVIASISSSAPKFLWNGAQAITQFVDAGTQPPPVAAWADVFTPRSIMPGRVTFTQFTDAGTPPAPIAAFAPSAQSRPRVPGWSFGTTVPPPSVSALPEVGYHRVVLPTPRGRAWVDATGSFAGLSGALVTVPGSLRIADALLNDLVLRDAR